MAKDNNKSFFKCRSYTTNTVFKISFILNLSPFDFILKKIQKLVTYVHYTKKLFR